LEDYPKDMQEAFYTIEKCEAVIFGMPVYQYTMSGVLKNFVDICGASVAGKPVGIIVNSG
jgi:NAD(P)H-dependent FMN reductase